MSDLFTLLAQITGDGESVKFDYSRTEKGQVRLLIQPVLGDDGDLALDDDAKAARLAMQRPLFFQGTHEQVKQDLFAHVSATADDRDTLRGALDDMKAATKNDAKKAAQAATAKKQKAGTASAAKSSDKESGAESDGDTPAPAPAEKSANAQDASTTGSIF